jgi:hypothetical protein
MWFSQLAYETGQCDTIDFAAKLWGFRQITAIAKHVISRSASLDTRCIMGERSEATIIAFGGTDPLVWQNVWTDADFARSPQTDTHQGFQDVGPLFRFLPRPIRDHLRDRYYTALEP